MRCLLLLLMVAAASHLLSHRASAGTRGSDELFWVPTLEQALQMARHTGRPIFLTHYTCVGEASATYSGSTTVW